MVVNKPVLDFETRQWYTLGIVVMDDHMLKAHATVVVEVLDVNDLTVSEIRGSPFTTAGGEKVTLVGSNMGPVSLSRQAGDGCGSHFISCVHLPAFVGAIMAHYGSDGTGYTATSCIISGRNTEITCTTVKGVGSGLKWTLTVGQWTVVSRATASYIAPNISSVAGLVDVPTIGGTELVIMGNNFGPLGYVPVVTYTHFASGTQYTATRCSVTSADVVVTCMTVPGAGVGVQVAIAVGGQSSNAYFIATGYATPSVAEVTPLLFQTVGSEKVVLKGSNFGPAGLSLQLVVRYGPVGDVHKYTARSCVRNSESSHTQIECKTEPGVGSGHLFSVEVVGQESQLSSKTAAYGRPSISAVGGKGAVDATTEGGDIVGRTQLLQSSPLCSCRCVCVRH
jgi:hypothetical protein